MSVEETVFKNLMKNMVFVDEGTLLIPSTNVTTSQKPSISLAPFYINRYPVSKKEWLVIMGKDIRMEYDNFPIVNVSWYDCQDFINRLNRLTKGGFRLPSKLEWEFAASGGGFSHGYTYSGSNNPDDVAWYKTGLQGSIHEIALKRPNELGLYDMSGNVWEWCQDSCPYHYNPLNRKKNFIEDFPSSHRVIKGGSGGTEKELCQIPFTYGQHPDYRGCYVGFRIAL